MILTNPVFIAVAVLLVLCFLRVSVPLALLASAVTTGLVTGMDVSTTMITFITGIGEDPETALSYVTLDGLAAATSYTGVSDILVVKITRLVNRGLLVLMFLLGFISCFSQNLIPVYIVFIPILIPSLLVVMNGMKIDRRAVVCVFAFGLHVLHIAIPAGFGLIYHDVISSNTTENGMETNKTDVWHYTWPLGVVTLISFVLVVLFLYHKPKECKNAGGFAVDLDTVDTTMTFKHWSAVIATVTTLMTQLIWGSLPLDTSIGLTIMFIIKAVRWSDMNKIIDEGVQLMGFIAFVMLTPDGSSAVPRDSGGADQLIQSSLGFIGGSELLGVFIMMFVGLFIVMGIGTSFGAVPVLAALYVPLCAQLGFSVGATMFLIAAAATVGDAGFSVSDTTFGPIAGLNADGQHDRTWDTCVPTFIVFDIPIFILTVAIPPLMRSKLQTNRAPWRFLRRSFCYRKVPLKRSLFSSKGKEKLNLNCRDPERF